MPGRRGRASTRLTSADSRPVRRVLLQGLLKQFRAYSDVASGRASAELEGTDLSTFHYGAWLLEAGIDFGRIGVRSLVRDTSGSRPAR